MLVSAVKERVPFGAHIFRVFRNSSWDVRCRCMKYTHFVMIHERCVPRCMQWACMHKLRWNEITYNVCITNRSVGVLFLSVQSSIKRDQHPRWSCASLYFVDSFSSYFFTHVHDSRSFYRKDCNRNKSQPIYARSRPFTICINEYVCARVWN